MRDNGLLAMLFDEKVGLSVMKKETYEKKLKDLLTAERFSERKNLTDSVIRIVKGNPGVVLEAANKLHPNLQFTIEELNRNVTLAFLILNVNVDSWKKNHMCVVPKTH